MKLRIVTDGTFRGTRVETEDGQHVERVGGVTWSADYEFPGKTVATIRLVNPEIKVEQPPQPAEDLRGPDDGIRRRPLPQKLDDPS